MNTPVSEPVALRLIDREFLIACAPEERAGLLEAAGFLDRKMRELRANAKAPSFERLAVLTAISVTHEFLALRKQHDGQERRLSDGLAALRSKLDAALDSDLLKR
ncbi:cell division protein ZapA [Rhodanobacter sp. MP7CTX1]|uniref:cell division protein ZapA n=1 Tax=Rhodanobacter sp. MP7CTX1 TaxID=2723084 RepID=UPI001611CEF7|nr:cell division protein ZapA [Rhodanobacter sp. MP7CTX1]MBB6186608.1 cell division protein ZapA [Rhodanobacter sp. MP7CTX1]